jgi:hypothetical protein
LYLKVSKEIYVKKINIKSGDTGIRISEQETFASYFPDPQVSSGELIIATSDSSLHNWSPIF